MPKAEKKDLESRAAEELEKIRETSNVTTLPVPDLPVKAEPKSAKVSVVDTVQKKLDAVLEERQKELERFDVFRSGVQQAFNKEQAEHNKKMEMINTRAVELQGAVKFLKGELE